MIIRHIPVAVLASALFILTAACGSLTKEDIRFCEEVVPTQTKPVADHLACIHDVVQYKLEHELETAFSPSIVAKASITYRAALNSLVESGYLVEAAELNPVPVGAKWPEGMDKLPEGMDKLPGYYPTAEGMEYLRRHRYPKTYWLEQNWFLTIVAGVNMILGVAAAINLVMRVRKARRSH